jgi:peptidoglycan/LPS O-acetylase OafA/YrhL
LMGLTKRHRPFLLVVLLVLATLTLRDVLSGKPGSPAAPPGRMLVLAFLCGVALFLNRIRIANSHWLFLVSAVGFVVCVLASTRAGETLAAIFIAYVTVYLGLLNFSTGPITKIADYSYGVYLYGFPVQQSVAQLMPDHRLWYINFGLSLAVTFAFAVASWHLLESKVMARKKHVLAFVSTFVDRARSLVVFALGWLVRRPAEARATAPKRTAPTN